MGERRRSRRSTRVRLGLAALCASLASACMTPGVINRARSSTTTQSYETTIQAVKSASRLESGELILCLELRTWRRRQASVEVPLQSLGSTLRKRTGLDFGRDRGFDGPAPDDPTTLRYVFFEDDMETGCPETVTTLPIYTTERSGGSGGPGLYTTRTPDGLKLRYRSAKPLWSTLRDLEISPVLKTVEREREVPGKPIYWLALPFAVAVDALLVFVTLGAFVI